MAEIYKIGPFLISYKLIIIVFSGVFGYLVLQMVLKKIEVNRKEISDIVTSCILILILTWKFGGVLFNPKQIISDPLFILYITGNGATLLLGFILSTIYTVFKLSKNGISKKVFLDLVSLAALPFLFLYSLFIPEYGYRTRLPWGISLGNENVVYHPIHAYFAITIAIIMIYLYKEMKTIGTGNLYMKTSLLIGVSGLIFTFLSPQINYILGISQKQWMFIFLIFVGLYNRRREISSTLNKE